MRKGEKNMDYFFKYNVDWYEEEERTALSETGIVCKKTYADAVKRVTDYYGDDCILKLSIEQIGEDEDILTENDFPFTIINS